MLVTPLGARLLGGYVRLFERLVRLGERNSAGRRLRRGKEPLRLRPGILERYRRIVTDADKLAVVAPHDNPRPAVLAHANAKGRRRQVKIFAWR